MRKLIGVLLIGLVAFVVAPAVGYTADDPSPQTVQSDYNGEYIQVIASTPIADLYVIRDVVTINNYESFTAVSTFHLKDSPRDVGWRQDAELYTVTTQRRYFNPSSKYGVSWRLKLPSRPNRLSWNIKNYNPPTS